MDVHPTKNVSIGIDPYPHEKSHQELVQLCSSAQSWASGFAVVIAAFVWLLM
jgi:hypothetical protein